MKFLNLTPNTPEWEAHRRNVVGASDIAAIMGVSPWQSALDIWNYKMGISTPKVSPAMRRGTALEGEALIKFSDYLGRKMSPRIVEHEEYPFMIASLDGINDDGTAICEIKCPNAETHENAKLGIIPEYYNIQMQAQMACTGLLRCYYVSYDGNDIHVHIVRRDKALIEQIQDACKVFYHVNMLGFEPPAPDPEKDYVNKSADVSWVSCEREYLECCQKIEILEHEKDCVRREMILRSEGLNIRGSQFRLTNVTSKGRICYEQIPQLKDLNLEEFRGKPTQSVRITPMKGEKNEF